MMKPFLPIGAMLTLLGVMSAMVVIRNATIVSTVFSLASLSVLIYGCMQHDTKRYEKIMALFLVFISGFVVISLFL